MKRGKVEAARANVALSAAWRNNFTWNEFLQEDEIRCDSLIKLNNKLVSIAFVPGMLIRLTWDSGGRFQASLVSYLTFEKWIKYEA